MPGDEGIIRVVPHLKMQAAGKHLVEAIAVGPAGDWMIISPD